METNHWKKGIAILTSIYTSRMLGMFMVFPVFSLYAKGLSGANETLIGIALGIYGLTQGLLQIPFGHLSDKFGRKPLIIIGLILFLIGTVIAALTNSITGMIIGRAIQGTGAISSVTLAFATDMTPVDKRHKVMAIVGGTIGMAFVLSLILGPVIAGIQHVGVRGLFWVIAALVVIAIVLAIALPSSSAKIEQSDSYDKNALWKACFAVLMLHATFTGAFVVLPNMLAATGVSPLHQWYLYLPANIIAIGFMRMKATPHPLNFAVSFVILAVSYALMAMGFGMWGIAAAVTIFFIGFYRLETGLPHWVSIIADPQARGKAMGIYSTAQFVGSFVGAALSGLIWHHCGVFAVFIFLLILAFIAAAILLYWGKKDTLVASH